VYVISAQNKGEGIDRNVKIYIRFIPYNTIKSIRVLNKNRVTLIEGGERSTYATFKIEELLPEENQMIEIITEGKRIESFTAWSEEEQEIKNIFMFDVSVASYSSPAS
jgi:hypothetical protein